MDFKKEKAKKEELKIKKPEKYYEAVGRRKTAVARVRLYSKKPLRPGSPLELSINKKSLEEYFPLLRHQLASISPLELTKNIDRFRVSIKVKGGGVKAQAEATRHGLARALIIFNQNFKKRLKRAGFLTRDPRVKERKKPGLKKARRAPQWKKR